MTTDHYVGINVHKRNAQVAVLDDEGEVVEEVRVANADLGELAQEYAGSSVSQSVIRLDEAVDIGYKNLKL